MATPPDFTAGQVLTAAQMNDIGLWQITSAVLSGSSVSINNCFSADFNYYRIFARSIVTGTADIRFQLRAGGSNLTSAVYSHAAFEVRNTGTSGVAGFGSSLTQAVLYTAGSGASVSSFVLDIYNPFQTLITNATGQFVRIDPAGAFFAYGMTGFTFSNTASADGFTLSLSANSFGGDNEVIVYGYRD